MPQTILAVLALVLAMMMSLQQKKSAYHAQRSMVRSELVMQGTAVAGTIHGVIGSTAFDEKTAELPSGASVNVSALTAASNFPGVAESGSYNDIDDFHHSVSDSLKYRAVRWMNLDTGTVETDTLHFGADAVVTYANPDDPEEEASTKTKAKKVTVRVWSLTVENPDTAAVSRTYQCGSKCE